MRTSNAKPTLFFTAGLRKLQVGGGFLVDAKWANLFLAASKHHHCTAGENSSHLVQGFRT